jgi:hypothetical protein
MPSNKTEKFTDVGKRSTLTVLYLDSRASGRVHHPAKIGSSASAARA